MPVTSAVFQGPTKVHDTIHPYKIKRLPLKKRKEKIKAKVSAPNLKLNIHNNKKLRPNPAHTQTNGFDGVEEKNTILFSAAHNNNNASSFSQLGTTSLIK